MNFEIVKKNTTEVDISLECSITDLLPLACNNEYISEMSLDIFCPYNQTPMPSQAQVTEIIILGVNHMSHQRHVRDKCSYHPICKTDRLPLASNNEQISEMSLEIFCSYIQTPFVLPSTRL